MKGSDAVTIFDKNPEMFPFLHLQLEFSFTCAYNACSALMYYWSINNGGESDDKRISTIKINISRFIRDEVPGEEIAEFTLTTYKGAYLERVGTENYYEVVDVARHNDEDVAYGFISLYLCTGRPFVFSIECFPGLSDKLRLKYTGKVDDFYGNRSRFSVFRISSLTNHLWHKTTKQ